MGIGDELMAAGEAKKAAAGRRIKFRLLDKKDRPKWHFVWAGNPNIAGPMEKVDAILQTYVDRRRPYLAESTPQRYVFKPYRPTPAYIQIPPNLIPLMSHAAGKVIVNPTIKLGASPNKRWMIQRWRALVESAQDIKWLQIGHIDHGNKLKGAEGVYTHNFIEACALIAGARAVVCHEGALHHAAAAFGIPAVVIRGGYVSPEVTGYDGQVDFFEKTEAFPLGCGMRISCRHCDKAMARIEVGDVLKALRSLLEEKVAA